MTTLTLYRAADTDTWSDCASFAESLEAARTYLDNPGFGGSHLWTTTVEIDESTVLDLTDCDDAVAVIVDRIGSEHPGAIGADEYAPRVSYELRDAGVEWVRVRESYPADTITWIFVGSNDPELEGI
jgi:hypothetical protein